MLVNALTLLPSPTHTHTGENSHTHTRRHLTHTHLPAHTQEISLTLLQLHFKSEKFHFNPLPLQIDIVEMCISSHSSKPLISILNDIQVDSYPPPYSCHPIHATLFMSPYLCLIQHFPVLCRTVSPPSLGIVFLLQLFLCLLHKIHFSLYCSGSYCLLYVHSTSLCN